MNISISHHLEEIASRLKAIKHNPYSIKAFENVAKNIRALTYEINANNIPSNIGAGEKITLSIKQFITTDRSDYNDNLISQTPNISSNVIPHDVNDFREYMMGIKGFGPETISKYISNGYRRLKDVVDNEKLTHAQELGIYWRKHLIYKISRKEVEITALVVARRIDYPAIIVGSYRRDLEYSGDIDLLVLNGNIGKILESLGDLIVGSFTPNATKYYHGIIKIFNIARSIDIRICDEEELPYALFFYTGPEDFNRRMISLAKQRGYNLNEKEMTVDNKRILVNDDRDIFSLLGIDYISPSMRK